MKIGSIVILGMLLGSILLYGDDVKPEEKDGRFLDIIEVTKHWEESYYFSKEFNYFFKTTVEINASADDRNTKDQPLNLTISARTVLYQKFTEDGIAQPIDFLEAKALTSITFSKGINNNVNRSSTNGYKLLLHAGKVYTQSIDIQVMPVQICGNEGYLEVELVFYEIPALINDKLFLFRPQRCSGTILKLKINRKNN